MVLSTVHLSQIYHIYIYIDIDFKLAIRRRIHCSHCVYEGPGGEEEIMDRGVENRRAFVSGSLNSVGTVLSYLFISLLFFSVR